MKMGEKCINKMPIFFRGFVLAQGSRFVRAWSGVGKFWRMERE